MKYSRYKEIYNDGTLAFSKAAHGDDFLPVIIITMYSPGYLSAACKEHLYDLYNFVEFFQYDDKCQVVVQEKLGTKLRKFLVKTELDYDMRVQLAHELLKKIVPYDKFPNAIKKQLINEEQILVTQKGIYLREIADYTDHDYISDKEIVAEIGKVLNMILFDAESYEYMLMDQMIRGKTELTSIKSVFRAFRNVFIYENPLEEVPQRFILNDKRKPAINQYDVEVFLNEQERQRLEIEKEKERQKIQDEESIFNAKIEEQTSHTMLSQHLLKETGALPVDPEETRREQLLSKLSGEAITEEPQLPEQDIEIIPKDPVQEEIDTRFNEFIGLSLVKRPHATTEVSYELPAKLHKKENTDETDPNYDDKVMPTDDHNDKVTADKIIDEEHGHTEYKGEEFKPATQDHEINPQNMSTEEIIEENITPSGYVDENLEPIVPDNDASNIKNDKSKNCSEEHPNDQSKNLSNNEPSDLDSAEHQPCEPLCNQPDNLDFSEDQPYDEDSFDQSAEMEKESVPVNTTFLFENGLTEDEMDFLNQSNAEDDMKDIPAEEDNEFNPYDDSLERAAGELQLDRERRQRNTNIFKTIVLSVILIMVIGITAKIYIHRHESIEPHFTISATLPNKIKVINDSKGKYTTAGYYWEVFHDNSWIQGSYDKDLILKFEVPGKYTIKLYAEDEKGQRVGPFIETYTYDKQ